jgi:hypothetical protein
MPMLRTINFPKINDSRGNLTFLQHPEHIPFEIKRVFWIYDVPGGEQRGGHAYKKQREVIIALSGSFDVVVLDVDGKEEKHTLNRSYHGLMIPPMTWRRMENFSTNAISLHLSDRVYDENDYIRDTKEYFAQLKRHETK